MPALAALPVILLAVLALLLIYGLIALARVLGHIFPSSIGIGSFAIHPRAWIELGIIELQVVAKWLLGDVIRPVVNFFLTPAIALIRFIDGVVNLGGSVASQTIWLVDHGIPDLAVRLTGSIASSIDWAVHWAAARVASVEAYLNARINSARAYAHALAVGTQAWVASLVASTAHTLSLAITSARAYAHALAVESDTIAARLVASEAAVLTTAINAVRATVTSELGLAERYADTVGAAAIRAMRAELSDATAAVVNVVDVESVAVLGLAFPEITDVVKELEGVIGTDLPDIGAAVRAIPRAIPTDLADALGLVGAISIPMLRYLTRCGIPNCRNLSQLGRELSNLGADLAGGAFLVMLAELIRDPSGTARFLDDTFSPLADDAISGARALLGV